MADHDGSRLAEYCLASAPEFLSSVQIAMMAGLPYTILRVADSPDLAEGLIPLFSSVPSVPKSAAAEN